MVFKIITIAILLAFYGCYFGKMILQHRKGIKTDHMVKGKVGFVKFIEVTLKIVTFIVPVIEVISIFVLPTISPVWLQRIGTVVGVLGVVVFICSVVTGKVFCADCGAKLHYCTGNSFKDTQDFFVCANYRSNTGTCTGHYIRAVTMNRLVFRHIQNVLSYIQ